MSYHRCPGWGVTDCKSVAYVDDEAGDRCPECHRLNRKWQREYRKLGKPYVEPETNVGIVTLKMMLRCECTQL
jgi:hypothetical protein